jgi:hypothetical protein
MVVALMMGWVAVQAQVAARWDTTEQVVGGMVVLEAEFAHEDEVVRPDTVSALVWIGEEVDSTGENTIYRWTALAVDTGQVPLEGWAVEPLVIGFLPAMEGLEKEQDRAPIDVPFSLWWWILAYKWWLLAGALALAGAGYLWRNWTPKTEEIQEEPVPEDNPFEVAMQALEAMHADRPWEKDVKQYYVALGDLVRHYLSIRSGLPLSEKTTEEALALVKMKWTAAQREDYAFIMSRADVVKFAKGTMDVDTHLGCLAKAEALIVEFKPEDHGE